jgi:dipeptidyl aminopeptidase/acylaminoacyl peptidase
MAKSGHRRVVWLLFLVSLAVLASTAPAWTQTSSALDAAMRPLFAARHFNQVAISSDGHWLAWLESRPSSPERKSIFVEDLRATGSPPRLISPDHTAQGSNAQDLAWSPDSSHLAFLSDAHSPGQFELYEARPDGSSIRQLTHLTGALGRPQWSPDGNTIGLLFIENAPRVPGPLQPMSPPSGVIESHVYEQRFTTVDVASGQVRQISPPDLYVYEYDWSPDGKQVAAVGAYGSGDNNWWLAQLYLISVESGAAHSIYKPPLQIAQPRWSPDGKNIALIGGLMSDQGADGGDIYLVPATGGPARNVTPDIRATPCWIRWDRSSRQLLFAEIVDGESGIAILGRDERVTTLWKAPVVISRGGWLTSFSTSSGGKTFAVIQESFDQPPEVWAGPVGKWTQITHANHDFHAAWGKARSVHWTSGNFRVQGWLLYPRDYDPSRHYPMVVSVHGGPSAANRPSWPSPFYNTSLLSSEGYFVFYPNPRGSFGAGERFSSANVKDFGYGDLRDILRGVDAVEKTLPVDDHRLGITGWSYGGYMTMWAVTQTHRFSAAVAGAGIADWRSYYGENDIDQWMIPFFGASVYDDPAVYARSSPIDFIKNVRTPTLMLVGDRDGECPAPQSFEFWHALKALGVPTQLVVYPDEGHDIAKPTDRRDIIERQIGWFDQYLKP